MLKHRGWLLASVALCLAAGGAGARSGDDPPKPGAQQGIVCPVMKAHMDASVKAVPMKVNNATIYTCCAACPIMLKKDPAKYLTAPINDPVTGKPFKVTAKSPKMEHKGQLFLFSTAESKAAFAANPAKYVKATQ